MMLRGARYRTGWSLRGAAAGQGEYSYRDRHETVGRVNVYAQVLCSRFKTVVAYSRSMPDAIIAVDA
eukprot:1445739-Rhodomonas_salina.3